MIKQLTDFPDNVLAFVCEGHVTRADYETVLIPAVTERLKKLGKVRLYYETATDFNGIDPGAVWEDLKTGIEHLGHWERVAIVSDVEWIKHTVRLFRFLMPGSMKVFPTSQAAPAREWVTAANPQ
jgi:hypothetical protein